MDLDSLPDRPLSRSELRSLRTADAVVEAAPLGVVPDDEDEEAQTVAALAVQREETLYGLGYDDGWTVVTTRTAGDPDDLRAVRDAVRTWRGEDDPDEAA
ncbi:MAG: hypothetical protein ABEJ79_06335 [Halolamina sp.]